MFDPAPQVTTPPPPDGRDLLPDGSQLPLADVLRRAKALIGSPELWCQFEARNESGQICAAEALVQADYMRVNQAAKLLGFNSLSDVAMCNDGPGVTHADMMKLFDRGIARAEKRGA